MSDDLISRKEAVELAIAEYDRFQANGGSHSGRCELDKVIKMLQNMPTAFDKEKVIEDLKSAIGDIHYTEDGSFNGKCIEDFEFIQAKTALELVEKGGIE